MATPKEQARAEARTMADKQLTELQRRLFLDQVGQGTALALAVIVGQQLERACTFAASEIACAVVKALADADENPGFDRSYLTEGLATALNALTAAVARGGK